MITVSSTCFIHVQTCSKKLLAQPQYLCKGCGSKFDLTGIACSKKITDDFQYLDQHHGYCSACMTKSNCRECTQSYGLAYYCPEHYALEYVCKNCCTGFCEDCRFANADCLPICMNCYTLYCKTCAEANPEKCLITKCSCNGCNLLLCPQCKE